MMTCNEISVVEIYQGPLQFPMTPLYRKITQNIEISIFSSRYEIWLAPCVYHCRAAEQV